VIELLHAIWQADSGFPSGSFAFSGGLEAFYALSEADATALPALLHDMLALRWASSDRVALSRAHRASGALNVRPASGALSVRPASGTLSVRPASGALNVRPASGALSVRPASGALSVRPASGALSVRPASGALNVRPASGALSVRPASGALNVRPASGALDAQLASNSLDAIAATDAALEAAILVQPLREGSRRNGMALLAAHERLGTAGARPLRAACRDGQCLGHLAVMQGALFRAIGMDLPAAIAAAGYGAAASLVTAAVRLGRVGAIEGQRALSGVLPLLAHLASHPPPPDAVPEAFLLLLDIAAARHARAGMRLFAT
jgi:urease accessory protein